jgi:hypothetical protein
VPDVRGADFFLVLRRGSPEHVCAAAFGMTLTRCFDAAYPPLTAPPGAGAVLGYIGSDHLDRDFHIWTPAEWLPFKGLRQFPVWECNPAVNARASASTAVGEMRRLGWNYGRALIGAMETYIAPDWWAAFGGEVRALGMFPVCYGSESTVYRNDATWYWEALYDGIPALPAGRPSTLAKQYLSLGSLDWSVVSPELLQHGGQGPRNQAA